MRMDFPRLSDWEIAQLSIHEVHQTLEETVPTSIRKAEHFIAYLQSLIAFFKSWIHRPEAWEITNTKFLQDFSAEYPVDVKSFRFTSDRLSLLLKTLEIGDWSRFRSLATVAEWITVASTYSSVRNGIFSSHLFLVFFSTNFCGCI